jgi:3-hydroxybutyryl-CoA dehydrogenase
MKFVISGSSDACSELMNVDTVIEWMRVNTVGDFSDHRDADAFFDIDPYASSPAYPTDVPVFINSVIVPLSEMKLSTNILRINGWKGFISRKIWEVAGIPDQKAERIISHLGKRITWVADEPGLVSARIIAMIINEAWFAKGEDVSTNEEIDTAMKLGTNYPKGPFEWAKEIDEKNIVALLNKLKETDERYSPAPLLMKSFGTP